MVNDRWHLRGEAKFNVVVHENEKYLVCHTRDLGYKVQYVESIKTGERKIPDSTHENLANHEVINALLSSF